MELILTFRKLIWHYWPRLSLAFFCFFVFVSTKILFMPLIKDFYGDIAQGNMRNFIIRVFEGFGLLILHCLSMYGKDFNMSYVAQRMIMKIRIKIYEQLQRLSMDFFNKWKSGEIISRMTQDLSILETGFRSTLIEIPTHIVTLIGVLGYMVILNWQMLFAFFLLAPAIVWISKYYGELTRTPQST
jgi:subfamily B ATP-binding cassette protein MsbA